MRVPDLTNIEPINEAHVRELQEQVVGDGSLFNRLYSIFESEGPELIAELRELLPKGVHADIHEVIHKMKGSSAAMGGIAFTHSQRRAISCAAPKENS